MTGLNDNSALYLRSSRPFSSLALACADGRYPKLLDSLAKTQVLVLDDCGSPRSGPSTGRTCSKPSRAGKASAQSSSPASVGS